MCQIVLNVKTVVLSCVSFKFRVYLPVLVLYLVIG